MFDGFTTIPLIFKITNTLPAHYPGNFFLQCMQSIFFCLSQDIVSLDPTATSSDATRVIDLDEDADNLLIAGGANGEGRVAIMRSDGVVCEQWVNDIVHDVR